MVAQEQGTDAGVLGGPRMIGPRRAVPRRLGDDSEPDRPRHRGTTAELPVITGRRVRIPLALDGQLVLVVFAPDLRPRLLVGVALGDIGLGRRVGGGRHLVRIEVVKARRDPLLLGQAGKLVVIEVPGDASVLAAVAVELLSWLALVLIGHHITTWQSGCRRRYIR